MMHNIATFELPEWIDCHKENATAVLAGSATPSLSIRDLIELSSDQPITASRLKFDSNKLSLGSSSGGEELRQRIANLYEGDIAPNHVLTTNGTTGANSLLLQSLLQSGDHVIAMYPAYMQLIAIPACTPGVDISFWSLREEDPVEFQMTSLKRLIRSATRVLILNNPNNPLGSALSVKTQREIINVARLHGLTIVVDEIFRPLHHDPEAASPLSFLEIAQQFENVVVTGSLSKAWGLPGVRVGWIVTKNADILARCFKLRPYTITALSTIDEIIATEVLSDRCRPQILSKHLELARINLDLLDKFVKQHRSVCSWTKPSAGATAFVRFCQDGGLVDDVELCLRLKEQTGVLLAPGSLCFGHTGSDDFRGFVRIHITVPTDVLQSALLAIETFMERSQF